MKDRKKYFLKDAVVVLIAVFMVTSIIPAAMADTSGNAEDIASRPTYTLRTEGLWVPRDIVGTPMGETKLDGSGSLSFGTDFIQYHDDSTENALGLTAGGTATEAVLLTDAQLSAYRGWTIDEVIVCIGYDAGGPEPGVPFKVWTYAGTTPPTDPSALTEWNYEGTSSGSNAWNDVMLTTTFTIPATGDVWVGVLFIHSAGQYPMGIDEDTTTYNGGWLWDAADGWINLNDIGFPGVFGLTVGVSEGGGPGPEPQEDCIPDACDFAIAGFTDEFKAQSKGVDFNGDGKIDYYVWNSLPKEICIKIANKGEIGIGELKLLLDLYKKVCGPTITIFDNPKYDLTQFPCCGEDYPIDFEGWHIEDDCDGDSWVLQGGEDNRWLDNNQAWRNTKGEDRTYGADDDIYLGLADCVLPDVYDTLTTPMFDVAGAACATFTFWHWVEGEYTILDDGTVNPVDYGTIAYSLNNGLNWTEISMSDFLAYDTEGEWQKVTLKFMNSALDADDLDYMHPYNMICDDCEPKEGEIVIDGDLNNAQLRVKFIWHKDPCLQFEGWYIDGVVVTMTLDYELELVCQTHEIIELPPCDPELGVVWIDYCFPLPCEVDPDTWYEIHIYGQVFDPIGCEAEIINNEFKYQFKIEDVRDIACIEMNPEDQQYVSPGDCVPVNVTVQNQGTWAEDNVPVEFKVGSLVNYQLLEDHYETNTLGDYSIYYFNFDGCPTLMPYVWSKGWSQISEIYDNAPAEARSMLPGSECVVFGANEGGFPTLPEDTGMVFVASESIILDPNHNGVDCADPIGAMTTFTAKWSMEIGSSTVYMAVMPSEGVGAGWVSFISLGIDGDADGYENDWQSFEIDLYELLGGLIGEDYGSGTPYTYIPECTIGFFIYNEGPCTEDNMNYMTGVPNGGSINVNNPVPWTGFMLDNWKISVQDYDASDMDTFATLYTGELQPGEKQTLATCWPAVLCTHVITAETQLDGDVDPYNDGCCAVVVTATDKECITEYKVDDLTGGGDCLWHVCCNRDTADDCFAWAGVETEHSAEYVNNMDDYMVSPTIDLTGISPVTGEPYADEGVAINFTAYWEFYNKFDYGELQMKQGANWVRLWKTDGATSMGVFVPICVYIDDATCELYPIFQLRFRMYSDGSGVDQGFYVDDIQIVDVIDDNNSATFAEEYFGYSDGSTENAFKWTDGSDWYEAMEFSSPEAADHIGKNIVEVVVSVGCDDYGFYAETFNVWGAGYKPDMTPGAEQATLLGSSIGSTTGWATYELETPYTIEEQTFLIIQFTSAVGYPAGFDMDSTNDKGAHVLDHASYTTWTTCDALGYNAVWGIDAGLGTGGGGGVPEGAIFGDPIPGIFQGGDGSIETFEDQDIAPWTCTAGVGGQYWVKTSDPLTLVNEAPAPECDCEDAWYAMTGYGDIVAINDAIAFKIDLTDPMLNPNLILFSGLINYNFKMEKAYIEFSPDWDGVAPMEEATWVPYWVHSPGDLYGDTTGGWVSLADLTALVDPVPNERWNIDEFVGETVWVRFRVETDGNGAKVGEGINVACLTIEFKATGTVFTDTEAPITSFCFDEDSATVTLMAVDLPLNKGVGVDATYYKIDGGATQTYGGPFTIGEGTHTIEYWSVDNNGNEELPHKTVTVTIDTTPPVVEIIKPEEGKLYLFGSPIFNRILSDKTLCIGKVPVEATATDASGISRVLFSYDGETHWDDTAPYTDTYTEMHFGPLTITAIAIDNNGMASEPDTMDIVVYNLGLF